MNYFYFFLAFFFVVFFFAFFFFVLQPHVLHILLPPGYLFINQSLVIIYNIISVEGKEKVKNLNEL